MQRNKTTSVELLIRLSPISRARATYDAEAEEARLRLSQTRESPVSSERLFQEARFRICSKFCVNEIIRETKQSFSVRQLKRQKGLTASSFDARLDPIAARLTMCNS